METKPIVESLLYHSKSRDHLRNALKVCRVINDDDRNWKPVNHLHLSSYVSEFEEPLVIAVFSNLITCFIIEPKATRRVRPVLQIRGSHTEFMYASKDLIGRLLNCSTRIGGYLPETYSEQVFWIPYKKKEEKEYSEKNIEDEFLLSIEDSSYLDKEIEMVMFTHYKKGNWTIDEDITSPDVQTTTKTSFSKIFQKLVREL